MHYFAKMSTNFHEFLQLTSLHCHCKMHPIQIGDLPWRKSWWWHWDQRWWSLFPPRSSMSLQSQHSNTFLNLCLCLRFSPSQTLCVVQEWHMRMHRQQNLYCLRWKASLCSIPDHPGSGGNKIWILARGQPAYAPRNSSSKVLRKLSCKWMQIMEILLYSGF